MPALPSLRAQKRALRKTISTTLSGLSASSISEQSAAVTAKVVSLPAFQRCTSVSCYLSMPSGELDTSGLVDEILRSGKTLYVPKIDVSQPGKMDFFKVYGNDDLKSLPRGAWDIREPDREWQGQPRLNALDEDAEGLDMILLPGVAFDRSLSRLGHGKGYYDRFIETYLTRPKKQSPLLVALALREQLLGPGEVPVGDTDWNMDIIVTPDEIVGTET